MVLIEMIELGRHEEVKIGKEMVEMMIMPYASVQL